MAPRLLFFSVAFLVSVAASTSPVHLSTRTANSTLDANTSREWDPEWNFIQKMYGNSEYAKSVLLVFALSFVSTLAAWLVVVHLCVLFRCRICLDEWSPDDFN
ncbi:hypothetical protein QR680_013199 [Steinernema hermaphroditum]|uniref:Uncharacterized protein n=1 Tax=Steinernema hermaphroditum TaxID=289476 RepID=A0AA39M248_9BILA|nr:hypothetical protein QR680_013199 [Steinernema hermaphroditum]